VTIPRIPNPFDDDAQRLSRLEAQLDTSKRRRRWVLVAGVITLIVWAVLAKVGLPGTGLVLVPIGILMILGSVLELG
jgi:hypothetical protein